MNKIKSQLGLTLIEVLVALVVMSIGLLGLAALQTDGLRSETTAIYQSRAVHLASEIADRIRANFTAKFNYTVFNTNSLVVDENCDDPTANLIDKLCDTEQMARYDLLQWKNNIESPQTGLPVGFGRILVGNSATPGLSEYTIQLRWAERSDVPNQFYEMKVNY